MPCMPLWKEANIEIEILKNKFFFHLSVSLSLSSLSLSFFLILKQFLYLLDDDVFPVKESTFSSCSFINKMNHTHIYIWIDSSNNVISYMISKSHHL